MRREESRALKRPPRRTLVSPGVREGRGPGKTDDDLRNRLLETGRIKRKIRSSGVYARNWVRWRPDAGTAQTQGREPGEHGQENRTGDVFKGVVKQPGPKRTNQMVLYAEVTGNMGGSTLEKGSRSAYPIGEKKTGGTKVGVSNVFQENPKRSGDTHRHRNEHHCRGREPRGLSKDVKRGSPNG